MPRRRRRLAALLVLPLTAVAALTFAALRLDLPDRHGEDATAVTEEASGAEEGALVPLAPVAGADDAAYATAGGGRLPPGTRLTGRRRAVAPDGRVFVKRRGEEVWTRADAPDAGAAPKAPTAEETAAAERQRRLEQFVALVRAEQARTTLSSNVRVTPLPGDEAATQSPAAANWKPASETFVQPAGRGPDLGSTRIPGARRVRGTDPDAEAAELALVTQHGLRGDYYDFLTGRLFDIPDLTTLPPSHTRIDMQLDFASDESFALPFDPETFAALWRGYLIVPAAGSYVFTCGSDDGVRLSIDGTQVLEYKNLRAYGETSGTIELSAGRHPIEVVFYENEVFASCRLFWQGPGFEKQIVPAENLAPPDDVAAIVQPHLTRIEPDAARVGEVVELAGVGFSTALVLNRVTFAGVTAEILESTDRRMRVRVPVGASTGDAIVQVGPLSSLPKPFEVTSDSGLFAEYYHIGSDLSVMPDFTQYAPFFVRLEGPLDFHQDNLWDLPYDPDVFAARYSGYIYFPEEDDYRITLGSDDGADVRLDEQPFLDAPNLHPYQEVTRTAHFTQGFHPVEIRFFENRGVARLRLFWQRAADVERQIVPRGFLFPPEDVSDRPTPRVTSIDPPAAGVGDTITIAGSGFGASNRYARVHFGGDVWARPEFVTDESLTVVVPYTAATGDLRVEVGMRLSGERRFTVSSPHGLTADYYVFGNSSELRDNASPEKLAERAPTLSRVETLFQREKQAAWKLPFPAERFAVHWHGTLGVPYPTSILWVLQADDGAYLHVDGKRVADCGPFHDLLERYGTSHLAAGEHRVDLWYFQDGGDLKLKLLYTPIGKHDHRPVPDNWFEPEK